MENNHIKPDYIFETSWEVCNQVGGIYTVLSTRAKTLQKENPDKIIFIGPDIWKEKPSPWFIEDKKLFSKWTAYAKESESLNIRVGRWDIPGSPIAILVDFDPMFHKHIRHRIYDRVWNLYGVSSIAGYGDYHESASFGVATGMVIESFYRFFNLKEKENIVAHFNEWQTSFGLFYIRYYLPAVATIFTTHATSIGRSIAGNNKPLYDYLEAYHGDQMARELNMEAKHSAEKISAHISDCFTTVSDITGVESQQLLDKKPDVITPNGFEDNFVPTGDSFKNRRREAKEELTNVAEALLGYTLDDDVLFVGTSGRNEFRNKGIDAYIDALAHLNHDHLLTREVVAFIFVPAYSKGPRKDLQENLINNIKNNPLPNNYITHEMHNEFNEQICSSIHWHHFDNKKNSKLKLIFIPSYLNGFDGIFNKPYYDLLIGLDLTIFPSYYEPWGYTPLESIAFSIPTITTNLSGFGIWAKKEFGCNNKNINTGVVVIERTDYNYQTVVEQIKFTILVYTMLENDIVEKIREHAKKISKTALWENFIERYKETYTFAINAKNTRLKLEAKIFN